MEDINIRRGETLEITIIADDISATTVKLTVAETDGTVVLTQTENFATDDGDRIATIKTNDTDIPEATYEYMLTITYDDGTVEKLPDVSDCEDNCDLPTLTICKALDDGVS